MPSPCHFNISSYAARIATMLRKWLLIALLPFLLLFGQQALFAHEISHLGDTVPYSQDQAPHVSFCSQCLAISGLASALPSTPSSILVHTPPLLAETKQVLVEHVSPLHAYISRAPPALSTSSSR